MKTVFPIDFNAIRIALVNEIKVVTGLTCIVEEATYQNAPRPNLPYFGMKIITPSVKVGDDTKYNISGDIWGSGGQRKMVVSFDCYAMEQETAYNYMSLWQTALDLENIQFDLRKAGIAVWLMETVADLSLLLNTGYEGRAHMDVTFGIAMNLSSNLSEIDSVQVIGDVNEIQVIDETITS